jgi:hypothetical protein
MPELRIQLTKQRDGGSVLRCVRADGSSTWQRQEGRHASFFALHDLTHYAVETVLGFQRGFFGLVAEGWDIRDTTGKGARGPLPAETVLVEHIVGFLDAERGSGALWSAAEFNEQLALASRDRGLLAHRALTEADLAGIRARRREVFGQWAALAAGESLELVFAPSSASLA